jgi:hypothetical protein
MAKLVDRQYSFRGKVDGKVAFKTAISVNSDGLFTAHLPDQFGTDKQFVKFAKSIDIPVDKSCHGKFYIQAKTMDEIDTRMRRLFEQWLTCETTWEYVIRCHATATCHYALDDFGKIHPNGSLAQDASDVQRDEKDKHEVQSGAGYHWPKTLTIDGCSEPSFGTISDYCIGLKARIFKKFTHKRGDITQVEYSEQYDDDELGEWGQKLHAFVRINLPAYGVHELPYTEDAAKFMYLTMMSLCQMADNIVRFFGDDKFVEKFQKMIETGSLVAITAGQAGDEGHKA